MGSLCPFGPIRNRGCARIHARTLAFKTCADFEFLIKRQKADASISDCEIRIANWMGVRSSVPDAGGNSKALRPSGLKMVQFSASSSIGMKHMG